MKWIKAAFQGVRYREHPTRKHGVGKDRYFSIYYRIEGKQREESLGWATQGWTAQKANSALAKLREAHRTGEGAYTLRERRKVKSESRKKEARDSLTFGEVFTERYFPLAKENKSWRSWQRELQLFKLWIGPTIGNKRLIDVSPLLLERIKKNMSEAGRAPRSIEYMLATIRQVFNFARRNDLYYGDSPTSKATHVKKADNRRLRFLSREEASQLLALLSTRSLDVHDMALLSLHSGMRAGEIFNLTWSDVDLERGILTLKDTKSGRTRAAFLTDTAKAMLKRRGTGDKNALIFPDRNGAKIAAISNTFEKAVNELGLNEGITDKRQRVVFHTLRHTYASWLVENGISLYAVKELLGHRTLAMTERYSHLGNDTLQGAVKTLERSIGEIDQNKVAILKPK